MANNTEFKFTEGSTYSVISIGGRQEPLESEGTFECYATIGLEEAGIKLILSKKHGDLAGIPRIIPFHAILAIDIIEEKQEQKEEEKKETHHYYG